jgi:sec-independent protein translocase protein TatB
MFDIGFSELLIIAVVALIVLGPERLPKAARFAGLWVRKARAQWYSVKSEFEREMASDELRRSIAEPAAQLRDEVARAGRDLRDGVGEVDRELRSTADDARGEATPDAPSHADPDRSAGDDADSAVWPAADPRGAADTGETAARADKATTTPATPPVDPAQAPLDFDGVHRTPRRKPPTPR